MVSNRPVLKIAVFLLFLSFSVFEIAESADSKKSSIKISFRSQLHKNSDFKKFKLNHPIKISHGEIVKTSTLRILSDVFKIKKPLTILRVTKKK